MHGRTVRLTAATLVVGGGIALTACGGGVSSHVVGASPASTTTSVSAAPASSTPTSPSGTLGSTAGAVSPATTVPVANPVGASQKSSASTDLATSTPVLNGDLSQLDSELGALDDTLAQANSDLNDPPADN